MVFTIFTISIYIITVVYNSAFLVHCVRKSFVHVAFNHFYIKYAEKRSCLLFKKVETMSLFIYFETI